MSNLLVEDSLEHAGVLGMKWGVRKSPEKVARDKKAAYEAKADKIQAKANVMSTKIKALNAIKTDSAFRQRLINGDIKDLTKEKNQLIADAEKKRNGKLTSTEKKLLIGGVAVGSIILARSTHSGLQSGVFRQLASKGANFIATKGKSVVAFKRSDDLAHAAMSVDDIMAKVVKPINPMYGKGIGTKMNCRRATFAYEMRRRGNDVMATRTTNAYGQTSVGLLNAIRPGKKTLSTNSFGTAKTVLKESINKANGKATPVFDLTDKLAAGARNNIDVAPVSGGLDNIFSVLAKQPNGARGELGVMWGAGGGHSMAYEIVNGKAVVFDAQRSIKYESVDDIIKDYSKMLKDAGIIKPTNAQQEVFSQVGFTRLDNIDLNEDYLLRWIRNVD